MWRAEMRRDSFAGVARNSCMSFRKCNNNASTRLAWASHRVKSAKKTALESTSSRGRVPAETAKFSPTMAVSCRTRAER
jgi:hypothetical protein